MAIGIVPRPAGWLPATRAADGKPFWIVPASKGTAVYYTDGSNCTCPDARHRGRVCKHQRQAAQLERKRQPTPLAPPKLTYEQLFPACAGGCGDVADTRDGFCDRCASEREYQQRMQTRSHERVVEGWL